LDLVSQLDAQERGELEGELWSPLPDDLSSWDEEEIVRRVTELRAAEERGELGGERLTVDEAIAIARRPG
jgi:hypothetical protein